LTEGSTIEDRWENIFEDDDDRVRFLEILGAVAMDYNWLGHGYCLMNNHYHLIRNERVASLFTILIEQAFPRFNTFSADHILALIASRKL
jgi:hypothetical protein